MEVSIIIPAHNASATIAQTIHSVRSQTHSGWEAIIVDDGSTDGTPEVARKNIQNDRRFRLIQQEQRGEAGARNGGLKFANHSWLLFLDADDWIANRYLEVMLNELASNPKFDAVHCRSARVASDGTIVVEKTELPTGDLFAVLAMYPPFHVHSCVVRKSLVDAVGGFDTSLITCPDWDLWQRIARMGAQFGAVPEVLAFYRMTPNSASLNAEQMLRDSLTILKRGHSVDERVKNPHPDHEHGAPLEEIRTQQFYLLSWCAGLMIGSGRDARPLLRFMSGEDHPELWPPAVAECLFEAAPLPTCTSPQNWKEMLPSIQSNLTQFLHALEKLSQAPDFANRTELALTEMIQKNSLEIK